MEVDSKPEEIDEVDRKLVQLKIELESAEEGNRSGFEGAAEAAEVRGRGAGGEVRQAPPRSGSWRSATSTNAQKIKERLEQAKLEGRTGAAPR